MSHELPSFPEFSSVLSEDAFRSKMELGPDERSAADRIEREIAENPEKYRELSKTMGQQGQVLVYEDPKTSLEVTFQIDKDAKRILFFRFTERRLRLRKTIFISYSHKDSIWLKQLRSVFEILEGLGEISFWDDQKIEVGMDWQETLEKKLNTANAAVLLVNDAFLDSEFIQKFELPRILEEKKKDVYWIHLSKSAVAEKEPRITRFQSLSTNPDITLADLVNLGDKDLNSELLRIAGTLSHALSKN